MSRVEADTVRTAVKHAGKLSIFESTRKQRLESDHLMTETPTNVGTLVYKNTPPQVTLSTNMNSMYNNNLGQGRANTHTLASNVEGLPNVLRGTDNGFKK